MSFPTHIGDKSLGKRGACMHPFPHQGAYCEDRAKREEMIGLFNHMHLDWTVLLDSGGSTLVKFDGKTVIEHWLDHGVYPIIRYHGHLNYPFQSADYLPEWVAVYGAYGLKPIIKLWNEPGDKREWKDEKVPPDWWYITVRRVLQAADLVIKAGGIAMFPDGPGYIFRDDGYQHPFIATYDQRWMWDEGLMVYGAHCYNKGRPWNFPYDPVSQFNKGVDDPAKILLTEADLVRLLDDFYGDPAFNDVSLDRINQARLNGGRPGMTVLDPGGNICWRSYGEIAYYAGQVLGYIPDIGIVEGGRVPKDRPGTGEHIDIRWPNTTPWQVAIENLLSYEDIEQPGNPVRLACLWLATCRLGGGEGFEDAAWYGTAYYDKYGIRTPIIDYLHDNPPGRKVGDPWSETHKRMRGIDLTLVDIANAMSSRINSAKFGNPVV